MFRKSQFLALRIGFVSTATLPLWMLLSACGGDGTAVAYIPPPPTTPTPTPSTIVTQTSWLPSPATSEGNSGYLTARLTTTPETGGSSSSRSGSLNDFSITTTLPKADGPFQYRLNASPGIFPGGLTSISVSSGEVSWDINLPPAQSYRYDNPYGDTIQYVGQRLTASSKDSDGRLTQFLAYDLTRGKTGFLQPLTPDRNLRTTLDYDIGYSYVAMGEWSWQVVDLNGTASGNSGDLLFVNGDRTPGSALPPSGTATYGAHSFALLAASGNRGIPFALTADFDHRTMSTRIDQDYLFDQSNSATEAAIGIHVGGSAPFTNDSFGNANFNIPLIGTANYSPSNLAVTPVAQAVSGILNGSFFGPHAEQVGGVFSLQNAGGTTLAQDAFVGQQHHP